MSLRLLGINIPTKYGSSHRRASLPVNRKRLLCSITPWYRGRRRGEVERLERDRRYPISWYIDLLLASNFLIIPASKERTRLEIRLLRASLSYRKSYFFFLNSRTYIIVSFLFAWRNTHERRTKRIIHYSSYDLNIRIFIYLFIFLLENLHFRREKIFFASI